MRKAGESRSGRATVVAFLATALIASAAPAGHRGGDASGRSGGIFATASTKGRTTMAARFGATRIVVTMVAHEIAIGTPSDSPPMHPMNACTYSHMPCSLVDLLEIHVQGREIDLPRSVFADWSDVWTMRLRRLRSGRYRLRMDGGDASEGYWVDVTFDSQRVLERTRAWGEGQQIEERTIYYKTTPLG
jgi:hypothetical protein